MFFWQFLDPHAEPFADQDLVPVSEASLKPTNLL